MKPAYSIRLNYEILKNKQYDAAALKREGFTVEELTDVEDHPFVVTHNENKPPTASITYFPDSYTIQLPPEADTEYFNHFFPEGHVLFHDDLFDIKLRGFEVPIPGEHGENYNTMTTDGLLAIKYDGTIAYDWFTSSFREDLRRLRKYTMRLMEHTMCQRIVPEKDRVIIPSPPGGGLPLFERVVRPAVYSDRVISNFVEAAAQEYFPTIKEAHYKVLLKLEKIANGKGKHKEAKAAEVLLSTPDFSAEATGGVLLKAFAEIALQHVVYWPYKEEDLADAKAGNPWTVERALEWAVTPKAEEAST